MALIGTLLVKISADLNDYNRQMASAGKRVQQFGADIAGVGRSLTFGISAPLAAIGLGAIKMAGEMEQAQVAFTTMTKNADVARHHLEQLKDFTLKTPFQFQDLTAASRLMQAYGFRIEEVIPKLRILGDAVSALGGGRELLERVVRSIGEIGTRGKITGEQLRELSRAGIPALDAVAKKLGVTAAEAQKMISAGAVDAQTALSALLGYMETRFAGGMEAQSRTILGMWSNVKDAITFTLADIGKALVPIAKDIVDKGIVPLLTKTREWAAEFSELPPIIQKVSLALAGVLIAGPPLIWMFGQLAMTGGALASMMVKLTGVASVAGAALTTLGVVLAVVAGALIAVEFGKLINNLIQLGREIPAVTKAFQWLADVVASAPKAAFEAADSAMEKFWSKLSARVLSATSEIPILGIAFRGIADLIESATKKEYKLKLDWSDLIPAYSALKTLNESIGNLRSYFRDWGADVTKAAKIAISALGGVEPVVEDLKRRMADLFKPGAATASGAFAALNLKSMREIREEIKAAKEAYEQLKKARFETFMGGTNLAGIEMRDLENARLKVQELEDQLKGIGKAADPVREALSQLGLRDLQADLAAASEAFSIIEKAFNQGRISSEIYEAALNALAGAHENIIAAQIDAAAKEIEYEKLQKDLALGMEGARKASAAMASEFILAASIMGRESEETQRLTAYLGQLEREMLNVATLPPPPFMTDTPSAAEKAADAIRKLDADFQRLGVTSTWSLQGIADANKAAYDRIAEDSRSSLRDVRLAWLAYERSQVEASYAAGRLIRDEYQRRVTAIDAEIQKLGGSVKKTNEAWRDFGRQVSTIMTDLSKGIADAIVETKGLGDTFTKIAKDIAKAIIRVVIEEGLLKLLKVIHLVNKDTLSLADAFKQIAKKIGELLGLGGGIAKVGKDAAQAAADIAKTAGGAAQTVGATIPTGKAPTGGIPSGTGAGGALGVVNAITGAVSAVADVVTAIWSVRMEGTLNAIEESTRYTKSYSLEILKTLQDYLPGLKAIEAALLELILPTLREIRDVASKFVSIKVDLGPTSEDQKRLTDAMIIRLNTFDFTAGDRLLDIYYRLGRIHDTIISAYKQIHNDIVSSTQLLIGGLAAIENKLPSTLERILGGIGGAIGAIGGGIGSAVGGLLGGIAGGLLGGIGSLIGGIFGGGRSSTNLGRIEENTRFSFVSLEVLRADAWARYEGLLRKLDDIWDSLLHKLDDLWSSIRDISGLAVAPAISVNLDLLAARMSELESALLLRWDAFQVWLDAKINATIPLLAPSIIPVTATLSTVMQGAAAYSPAGENIYNFYIDARAIAGDSEAVEMAKALARHLKLRGVRGVTGIR